MAAVEAINTAAGALAAGLTTSLHCAGMCGSVSCSLMSLKGTPDEQLRAGVFYHIGRVLSYTTLGAVAGALGRWPLERITQSPVMLFPWVLAVVLLLMACGMRLHLPRPPFLRKWAARTRMRLFRVPLQRGAFALGLATPLLPCGPLYMMTGMALMTGSAIKGAEFMMAFSMGTIPLLWIVQRRFQIWQRRLKPATMQRVMRGVCLITSIIIVARLWPHNATASEKNSAPSTPSCPFCESP